MHHSNNSSCASICMHAITSSDRHRSCMCHRDHCRRPSVGVICTIICVYIYIYIYIYYITHIAQCMHACAHMSCYQCFGGMGSCESKAKWTMASACIVERPKSTLQSINPRRCSIEYAQPYTCARQIPSKHNIGETVCSKGIIFGYLEHASESIGRICLGPWCPLKTPSIGGPHLSEGVGRRR